LTLSLSLRTLIRYSWMIALFAIIPGAAVYAVTSSMPKEYASDARILVGSLTAADLQEQLGYQQLARMYASLVSTPLVLEPAAVALGSEESAAALSERVEAFAPVDESILVITGTGRTPAAAASLTEAVAASVIEVATPERPTGLAAAAEPVEPLALLIQPAVEVDEPAAPNVLFDTLIATVVGLGLGLLLAMLLAARAEGRRQAPEPEPLTQRQPQPAGPYPR
jgi:capsular polysaccharide biosynthesis protein